MNDENFLEFIKKNIKLIDTVKTQKELVIIEEDRKSLQKEKVKTKKRIGKMLYVQSLLKYKRQKTVIDKRVFKLECF